MKMLSRTFIFLLSALLILFGLSGCELTPVPAESTPPAPTEPIRSLVLQPGESLDILDQFHHLESVDLRACEDYEGIWNWMGNHPAVDITYDVALGGMNRPHDITSLILAPETTNKDELMQNLKYLPAVTKVTLGETAMTAEDLIALREAYPEIQFSYSVQLGDTLYASSANMVDLSRQTPETLQNLMGKLAMLTELSSAELMAADGSTNFTKEDVLKLMEDLPGVFFNYSFEFFGQTLSTTDERVEFDRVKIGDENEALIRQALDLLTSCTYFKLDDCGVSTPVMASIRDDYPNVKVVWRIHIDRFNMLTDETVLRLSHRLNDSNVHDLMYMTDTVYMDIGHNDVLTDISFVQYMPNLECVIVSGAAVKDVSFFANCQKLVWLELCFCPNVVDISCLKDHPTLEYLNISFTSVSDISCLENVKTIDRLNAMGARISWDQQKAFLDSHPDCTYPIFTGKQPYGYGWRYNDRGYTYCDYYRHMREVFRYDDLNYWGNHREY